MKKEITYYILKDIINWTSVVYISGSPEELNFFIFFWMKEFSSHFKAYKKLRLQLTNYR